MGSSASVLFGSSVHEGVCIFFKHGIEQACPMSGSVWALLFHCVVRRLVVALPVGYSLTCFVEELAASMLDARIGLASIMPVLLLELRLATGLAHLENTQIMCYGAAPDFDIKRALQGIPGAVGLAAMRRGTYLGMAIRPDAQSMECDTAFAKYRSGAAFVRSLPGHFGGRVRAYRSFAVSVASFFSQSLPLRPEFAYSCFFACGLDECGHSAPIGVQASMRRSSAWPCRCPSSMSWPLRWRLAAPAFLELGRFVRVPALASRSCPSASASCSRGRPADGFPLPGDTHTASGGTFPVWAMLGAC